MSKYLSAEFGPQKQQRRDERRNFTPKSKPYSRTFYGHSKCHSISPSNSASSQDSFGADLPPPNATSPQDKSGFPTYAQYKHIEAAYLSSLSDRKKDKALITQEMFDNIWDVLHDPDTRAVETAQFRFWVRKMFTLSDPEETKILIGNSTTRDAKMQVVLHEGRPVAIKEQLYDLLTYCHGRSNHGGRDKTCTIIRQHYSWVPKELTSRFVKACPTCSSKRSGNLDHLKTRASEEINDNSESSASTDDDFIPPRSLRVNTTNFGLGRRLNASSSGGRLETPADFAIDQWPPSEGPLDQVRPRKQNTGNGHNKYTPLMDTSKHNELRCTDPSPPPRVHEVPSYGFIPHGWPFVNSEPLRVHATTEVYDRRGMLKFPEFVPSFSTLNGGELLRRQDVNMVEDSSIMLPPLANINNHTIRGIERAGDQLNSPIPESLQALKVFSPQIAGADRSLPCSPQIDPSLLGGTTDQYVVLGSSEESDVGPQCGLSPRKSTNSLQNNDIGDSDIIQRDLSPVLLSDTQTPQLRRKSPPAPLDLSRLQTSFNPRVLSPMTPDSASSSFSQRSFYMMSSAASQPSTATTAIATPTEECLRLSTKLTDEIKGLRLGVYNK